MIRQRGPRAALLATSSVAALAIVAVAVAQSASGYDLSWRAPFSGGSSAGGGYVVQGVAGQPLTGMSSGGPYQVGSGYLGGGAVKFRRVLPLLSRDGSP